MKQADVISAVMDWWWVFAFVTLILFFSYHAIREKERVVDNLKQRISELQSKKDLSLLEREELLSSLQSQNDPIWIEMILMKGLGVVPEGQTKVYFKR